MGGRHRGSPAGPRAARWIAPVLLPLVAAIGVAATVVAVVTAGGLPADHRTAAASPTAGSVAPVTPSGPLRPRSVPPLAVPASAGAADAAAGALRAVAAREGPGAIGTCDLDGPPRFDDPRNPDTITNRDCGYVDGQGRERSRDPWIDDQLLQLQGG